MLSIVNRRGIAALAAVPPNSDHQEPASSPDQPALPVALSSARPADWPATSSGDWEHLLRTVVAAGRYRLVVDVAVERGPDPAGELRVLVAGSPVTPGIPVRVPGGRHVVELVTGDLDDVVVQGRCVTGGGQIRAVAVLLMPA